MNALPRNLAKQLGLPAGTKIELVGREQPPKLPPEIELSALAETHLCLLRGFETELEACLFALTGRDGPERERLFALQAKLRENLAEAGVIYARSMAKIAEAHESGIAARLAALRAAADKVLGPSLPATA